MKSASPLQATVVFPGVGVHNEALAALVTKLHSLGCRGDYSIDVFHHDYQQMPLTTVAAPAFKSALWLGGLCCAGPRRCRTKSV